jgi:outer membrane protein assembly factor BamB
LSRLALVILAALAALPAPTAGAARPLWPTMRHDARNTGATTLRARYHGDRPWSFQTGAGVFSTPVVGAAGTVYVGSADDTFYALSPRGRVRWRLRTGGLIDAAAAVGHDALHRTEAVTVGSGDERLYHLRTGRHARRRIIWTFRPTLPPVPGQVVRWWEGNVAVGPSGDLYAGNTGGGAYRIGLDGRQRWVHAAGNSVWTTPAFGPGGTSFWGSLDLHAFALDSAGRTMWSRGTLGYVISSPAFARDGTLYFGSFDGKLYAVDAATGALRWTFQTTDHVYASPALDEDAAGRTRAIFIASADGSVYAVSPSGGQLWRYDTGDVVRSSPVLGRAPRGGGRIVYVGAGDGRLYALDGRTGRRRWSFDTTPTDPALRDRNDLNASPALGPRGVYIAGEHGYVWYVPYDWCLHRRDRRCRTAPGQPFGRDLARVMPLTPGGATRPAGLGRGVLPGSVLPVRLVVRRRGRTIDAGMLGLPRVIARPRFPFHLRLSGDRHYAYIVPDGFLAPGTRYRLALRGAWAPEAITPTGAKVPGRPAGRFDSRFSFRTAPLHGRRPPLFVSRARVGALVLRRLAVPLPPFLPSVNQIGFDQYELIAGTLAISPRRGRRGRVLVYVITGRRRADGALVPDPRGGLDFPIAGAYESDALALERRDLVARYSFGVTPQRRFLLRAQLRGDGTVRPGASLYTEVDCAADAQYGAALAAIGLCDDHGTLGASGTFLTRRYAGPAARRPRGVRAGPVRLIRPSATAAGALTATLRLARGARYRARAHVLSVALVDAATGQPVALDALAGARTATDRAGNIRAVTLAIPRGTRLPQRLRAYVVADVFPLAAHRLP